MNIPSDTCRPERSYPVVAAEFGGTFEFTGKIDKVTVVIGIIKIQYTTEPPRMIFRRAGFALYRISTRHTDIVFVQSRKALGCKAVVFRFIVCEIETETGIQLMLVLERLVVIQRNIPFVGKIVSGRIDIAAT